jgi:hypothetical protein
MGPRVLHMLGKHSTTEPHPQTNINTLRKYVSGEQIMRRLWELDISTVVLNDLQAEFGTAPASEESKKAKCSTAAFPKLFTLREVGTN